MGQYINSFITAQGQALIARAVAGLQELHFTTAKTSDYKYPEGTDFYGLTAMQGIKQSIAVSDTSILSSTMVQVRILFSNDGVNRPYLIQNIGLYAETDSGEALFSVTPASVPDEMPQYNGVAPTSYIYNMQTAVSSTADIHIVMNPAGSATAQEIQDIENPVFDDSGDTEEIGSFTDFIASIKSGMGYYTFFRNSKAGMIQLNGILSGTLGKTGDGSDLTNIFTQAVTRNNLVTGEKLSVTLGKIMRYFTDLKTVSFTGNATDITQDTTHSFVSDTDKTVWNGKVNASGGDISVTKVITVDAISDAFPVPAAGENVKTFLGKVKKFIIDFNSFKTGVITMGQLVNNGMCNQPGKFALDAAYGKILSDQIDQLNSDLGGNVLTYNDGTYYIQWGADTVPKKLGNGVLRRVDLGADMRQASNSYSFTRDLKNYPQYKDFTTNNFCVFLHYAWEGNTGGGQRDYGYSYNPQNGILTVSVTYKLNLAEKNAGITPYLFYIEE